MAWRRQTPAVPLKLKKVPRREQGIIAIQIGPTRLHHSDLFILEVRNAAPEKIGSGNKVRVEDGDEFALRGFQAILEGASLIAFPIRAVNVADREALRGEAGDTRTGHLLRFVG